MKRKINGVWYECIDIGCNDFKAAASSRKRQKDKHYLIWWLWYESFVRAWPRNQPFPKWLSLGEIPTINKNERNNLNQCGIYEIGDDGLLKFDEPNIFYDGGVDE